MTPRQPKDEFPIGFALLLCGLLFALIVGVAVWDFVMSIANAPYTTGTSPTKGELLQALASFAGVVLGTFGAFLVARWSLEATRRREQEREFDVARAFLTEISGVGLIDMNFLKLLTQQIIDGSPDADIAKQLGNFLDINDLTNGQDAALAAAVPAVSINFSLLVEARRRAHRRALGGPIDRRVADWSAADYLLSITLAWLSLLETLDKIVKIGDGSSAARRELRTIANYLLPHAKTLSTQIEWASADVPLPAIKEQ
jgi:hypothetical protein